MEIVNSLSWINLFLLCLLISQSACQLSMCREFISPLVIRTVDSSVGSVRVPRSADKYSSNQICEWIIMTAIDGFVIRLDLLKSDLQGRDINGDCNNDYVDIFDYKKGNLVFMDRFCGSDHGKSYVTSGNKMTIKFHSDAVLEFTGFVAQYQPVPAGPSKADQEESDKRVLDMAIGIPVGLLSLAVVVIFSIFLIRYCRRKKALARSQTTNLTQNSATPRLGLAGGNQPSGPSSATGPPNYYHGDRVGNRDLELFPGNLPLQVAMPRSVEDGSRNARSITPPPAYDSLDFESDGGERIGMPLTPPPYEMIVKRYMGPDNH